MKKLARIGAAAALCAVGTIGAVTAHADDVQLPVAERIAGTNRYDTAARVSQQLAPGGAPTVFLASGEGFADALGASAAAGWLHVPVLLTAKDSLPEATATELARLNAAEVIIVGGEGTVSPAVAAQVGSTVETVTRVAGPNRYRTSEELVQLLRERQELPGDANLVLASGHDYPDALTVVPLADQKSAPLLLVDGKASQLSPVAGQILAELNPREIYVVGGTGSISSELEATLPADRRKRLAGPNRYATSLAVVREFGAAEWVVMVSGKTYPDALVGGALAADRGLPLLAVDPGCLGSDAAQTLREQGVRSVTVVGGQATLSDGVASGQVCAK